MLNLQSREYEPRHDAWLIFRKSVMCCLNFLKVHTFKS